MGMFAHLINPCAITRLSENRGQAPPGVINIATNIVAAGPAAGSRRSTPWPAMSVSQPINQIG